jgi:DNA-binding XRE family transcriptional regulator
MPRGRPHGNPQPAPDLQSFSEDVEPELAQLAVRLGTLRVAKGWTRNQLADQAGISHALVASIEAGGRSPYFTTVVKLCRALDVTAIDNFLTG